MSLDHWDCLLVEHTRRTALTLGSHGITTGDRGGRRSTRFGAEPGMSRHSHKWVGSLIQDLHTGLMRTPFIILTKQVPAKNRLWVGEHEGGLCSFQARFSGSPSCGQTWSPQRD